MRTYLIKRLLTMIPMFFIMTGVFFFIQNSLPGGPVEEALSRIRGADGGGGGKGNLSSGDVEKLRADLMRQYGLDKPIHVRYVKWVHDLVTLEFGNSLVTRQPALETIVSRFPVSLGFGIPGFFLTYLICIPLGVMKALRDGSKLDVGSSVILFITYSIPSLVASVVFLLIFCTDRVFEGGGPFPLGGLRSDNFYDLTAFQQILDYVWHMALPVCVSLLGGFTIFTLLMKNSMLDVISSDYIRTARAKGLSEKKVIFKHALRNAILPLMVGIGAFLSTFVAGSIVIESVFGLPGMGLLFLDAISSRDFNVMMGVVVILSTSIMVGQLISDIAYVLIDPRIDFGS